MFPDAAAQLTPDVVWDRGFRSGRASCVAMMQPANHREGDDLPPIRRLALAEFRRVLAARGRRTAPRYT